MKSIKNNKEILDKMSNLKISSVRKSQIKKDDNDEIISNKFKFTGSLNYVIPLIIYEMKNNPENALKYIEFLKDIVIEEYEINIFNWIAYKNLNQFTEAFLHVKVKF